MFERLIATNFEDEESNRRGRLLNILVLIWGALVVLGLVVAVIRSSEAGVIAAEGGLLLVTALSYLLVHQGQLNPAIYLFLIGNAIFMTASLLPPGVPPILFFVIPYLLSCIVVVSVALLTPRSPFFFATLTTVLLLIAMALRGGPSAVDIPETKANEALYLAIMLPINYVLAALSWLYGRDISRIVSQLRKHSKALAAQLATNEALIKEIVDAAEELDSSANGLSTLTEELNASAEQIASTMQQMAEGAQDQASQAETASRSIEGIAAAARQIADSVEATQKTFAQARETLMDSVQALEALKAKSEEIEKIVELVDKFADQTSLLALNAAIEAARAGEHGRGFAVVAEEVGKLADSSGRSVREIAVLTSEIRARMEKVTSSMEKTIDTAERTAELWTLSLEAIQEQREATERIVGAINEVAGVAEQNASAAEEISASVEEQTASIEEIATLAQELANRVEALRALAATHSAATEGG